MNDYTPTDEQIEGLAEVLYESDNFRWRFATSDARAWCVEEKAAPLAQSPAFQSIIRAAQAEARDEAAAVLESVVDFWRADPDNWRFETGGDTRNWLMDVAADIRAGRSIVLSDDE